MPRKSGKAQQTRLTFTPLESSSPAGDRSPQTSPFRPARLRYSHPSKGIIRKGQLQLDDFAGHATRRTLSDEEEQKPSKCFSKPSTPNLTPAPSSSPSTPASTRHAQESEEEGDDIVQASARRRRHNAIVIDSGSDRQSDSDQRDSVGRKDSNHDATMPRIRSSRQLRSGQRHRGENDDSSDKDVMPKTRSATRKQSKVEIPLTPADRRCHKPPAADISGLGSAETSGAEELITRPTSRKRRAAEPKETFVVDDDDDENSEDSDDVVFSSPAKRRRPQPTEEPLRTPQMTSKQDKLDLEEDLLDLQDSAVKKTRTRGRLVNSAKSQRQRHLEILRRRRAGEKEEDDESEEGEEDDEEIDLTESGTRFQREDLSTPADFSRDSEADSDVESAVSSNEDLDRYEKDFVEEDESALGVPADMAEIPFEFTRHAYKQPRECFRDVVEWMVHNKLNPAFARKDDMYQSAFQKLDDEVRGRAGSQLISAVWNVNFRYALLARPQIDIVPFPTSANDHSCDACNRSGHPASSDIRLYGKPYSLDNFEPLMDTDESDEDEESSQQADGPDRDQDGHVLLDEDTRFYLGRHCKANAAMTHTLVHWRYHLNEWVIGYLEAKGIFKADRIVEREKWSQKKKFKYANETVDMMDEMGEVQRLWRDFHINLKAARETKESRW